MKQKLKTVLRMSNLEDLKLCVGSDDNDYVADWLMDFMYNTRGIVISDAEVMEYLAKNREDNDEG